MNKNDRILNAVKIYDTLTDKNSVKKIHKSKGHFIEYLDQIKYMVHEASIEKNGSKKNN